MLNIDTDSYKPLEQTDGTYWTVKCGLDTKALVTLGTILLHRDDEIFSHENILSIHHNVEPSIFLRDKQHNDKRYNLCKAQCEILENMTREGNKFRTWPRIELIYDIYCNLLNANEAPDLRNRLEEWLNRRTSYFERRHYIMEDASKVKSGVDVSETDE